MNSAALTEPLLESELFGHVRGAFTGADRDKQGLLQAAAGGTLFLDELGELPLALQAKLLRVLQEREIRRVGDHLSRPIDVRVVAATNVALSKAAATGRFREDLLFRLAVVRLRVPPLRERVEDVPLLAQSFWRQLIAQSGKRAALGPDAVAALCRHSWPGNVRELQNVVAALVVGAPTRGRVTARHVTQILSETSVEIDVAGTSTLNQARAAFERRIVATALARHGGRSGSAARELGLSRQGLAKAMKRLGLPSRLTRRDAASEL